jgi:hypothetical protein
MRDITSREHTILCKALAYAIETIEALPPQWQEWSDKEDMIKLLDTIAEHPEHYRICARGHIERRGVKGAEPAARRG